jgi:hypothetical protein
MKKIAGLLLLLGLFAGCQKSDLMGVINPGPNKVDDVSKSGSAIVVPDDYPTLRQAVDAATEGETILVREGAFTEEVYIHTKNDLTLIDVRTTSSHPVMHRIRTQIAVLRSAL